MKKETKQDPAIPLSKEVREDEKGGVEKQAWQVGDFRDAVELLNASIGAMIFTVGQHKGIFMPKEIIHQLRKIKNTAEMALSYEPHPTPSGSDGKEEMKEAYPTNIGYNTTVNAGRKGEEELRIYLFQAKQIEDTLRIVANTLEAHSKKTCLDRNVMQSWEMIKNVIEKQPDKKAKYG